jgi:NAD(P)H dehydrogenase (quinone)
MKMTVLYYTRTDTTKEMAHVIAEGMQMVEGVEAKAFSIDAIDEDWVRESKCMVLGTPTYLASASGDIVNWLEGPGRTLGFAGKVGGAFATVNYLHGGGELAIRLILDHMMVYGMLTYSGGGSHGVPVIHLGPVAIKGKTDEVKETFLLYGQRMAQMTAKVFGQNALN